MSAFVKMNMVISVVSTGEGEDDGLAPVTETSTPVWVNRDSVRSFNARKPDDHGNPRAGTRLTFNNSAGMAVTETVEQVVAILGRP